jgi:hypothetical protein
VSLRSILSSFSSLNKDSRMAEADEKAEDSPSTTYHSLYNDASTDMVIKSSDDIVFRVHSYEMRCYRYVKLAS